LRVIYAFSDALAKIMGLEITTPDSIIFYHKCPKISNNETDSDNDEDIRQINYICYDCLESGLYYENVVFE
jgi:hypothetical protein